MLLAQDVTTIISTVGFPIFCTLALGYFVFKAFQSITTANQEREKNLYTLLGETREQLNNAIKVNASFVEILSDLKNNVSNVQDDIIKIKSTLNMKEGEE